MFANALFRIFVSMFICKLGLKLSLLTLALSDLVSRLYQLQTPNWGGYLSGSLQSKGHTGNSGFIYASTYSAAGASVPGDSAVIGCRMMGPSAGHPVSGPGTNAMMSLTFCPPPQAGHLAGQTPQEVRSHGPLVEPVQVSITG